MAGVWRICLVVVKGDIVHNPFNLFYLVAAGFDPRFQDSCQT